MFEKEKIQPNKVNAPVLFIGVGGIGSKIIKGINKRCMGDDTSNIRFLVMDTDVNDLLKVNDGANVIAVQTSSTSTVEDYLKNDSDAREGWFPENKMLDSKAVSEGAGQVRAISRLALNATIKQGTIHKLYKAIDDLFLKDGGGLKQAIRVVIASTAAGGTGSGIAMEAGMIVRHYVKKNYPEAAVMIRGFLVMPGVMDTVIKTQSEKDSLRCNGYATIKEINAFMMKGSGFFDTVPELGRYKDLHIMIPNTSDGDEKISNLPFDFCFLMDRTDSNAGNMITLNQYIDYAAQSLYEQNIGPMRSKASSMEDNVLKLCISPEKLGRCRFGGTGASVLRYPYESVRDYIALNWARVAIIGSSAEQMTEEEQKRMVGSSWLKFETKFAEKRAVWENNPARSSKDEPTIEKVYTEAMAGGKEASGGDEFTSMLWEGYINPKIDALPDGSGAKTVEALAKHYLKQLINETITHRLTAEYYDLNEKIYTASTPASEKGMFESKFIAINELSEISMDETVVEVTKNFVSEVFSSQAPVSKADLGDYMLESFLSNNHRALHPNASRYLLYELRKVLEEGQQTATKGSDMEAFQEEINKICFGERVDGKKVNEFDIKGTIFGKEKTLQAMCQACDEKGSEVDLDDCEKKLSGFYETVKNFYTNVIKKQICDIALPAVEGLIKAYEEFYRSFEGKVPGIERKKEDIVTALKFQNGDCVKNILGSKKYLDKITEMMGRPTESGTGAAELYAKIFESVRENAYIDKRKTANSFSYEVKQDIFDDIIIEYYKDRVSESCDKINAKGILQAIKLEYDVKSAIELSEVSEDMKDAKARELQNPNSLRSYIAGTIETCNNLASPGIKKKDSEEAREVNAMACSVSISDGEGIRVDDYIPEAIRSATVSKYELCFFRSVYNIMPTQLSKLSAPSYTGDEDEFSHGSQNYYEDNSAGDYFRIYQKYMDKMGPDCKKSAIITPHIDMRWNSIVTMPELDLEYQNRLMRKIQKSMIYGFLYDRIHLSTTLDNDSDNKNYQYRDSEEQLVDLVVSNKTKCDVLYEVLDALYNDRLAVSIIREYVNKLREKCDKEGYQSHEELEFFKKLKTFKFKNFTNDPALRVLEDKVSLFTIALMYSNSLPAQDKDMAEMKVLVESIIEMVYSELSTCISNNKDALNMRVADVLVEQFNDLVKNYNDHKDVLKCGKFSDRVVDSIQGTVRSFMRKRDLEQYIDKMTYFEAE